MYVCLYVGTYARIHVCTYVHMYVCTYVCMHVCIFAQVTAGARKLGLFEVHDEENFESRRSGRDGSDEEGF